MAVECALKRLVEVLSDILSAGLFGTAHVI